MRECMEFRDISALLRENFVNISLARFRYCSHTTVPRGVFGMNMPKSRDIQAKIPLPQAIWNEFWLCYCERSEQ